MYVKCIEQNSLITFVSTEISMMMSLLQTVTHFLYGSLRTLVLYFLDMENFHAKK